ncbi:peptide chain release factor N(5)-glutamine methyltransferase [Ruminococcus sp.]|uniref:peptide chain release factor N(5)-glutamine methyltransferase n=1 Tax=Ruminococcus sp. TaxID=41978 RepID=UPI003F10049D
MTRREAFAALRQQLRAGGLESPEFEAGCLAEQLFGTAWRLMPPQQLAQPVTPEEDAALHTLARRRLAGEPLQYLLGEWEFYGLPFAVGPGVLIPRQDTETLVECALQAAEGIFAPEILDLCAGSGCIGIALAHCLPDARVTAVERSQDALAYLHRNIKKNAVQVAVIAGDVLEPGLAESIRGADIIVSNPPYLSAADLAALQKEVQAEPRAALDGGEDGLLFYRQMPALWLESLKPGGRLLFEIGMGQEEAVSGFLAHAGYTNLEIFPDLAGISRVVSGRRPAGERR